MHKNWGHFSDFCQDECKQQQQDGDDNVAVAVSVANVSFKRTNLLSERSERNHFMNWFVPFSVQLRSDASMPAGSGTAATHSWIFCKRCSQRAGGDSLACTQRTVRTWFTFALWFVHDSRTYCTQRTVAEDVILVHALCLKWRCVSHSVRTEDLIHVQ